MSRSRVRDFAAFPVPYCNHHSRKPSDWLYWHHTHDYRFGILSYIDGAVGWDAIGPQRL